MKVTNEMEAQRVPNISNELERLLFELGNQELADLPYFIQLEMDKRLDAAKQKAAIAVAEHTALHHTFGRSPL